MGAIFAGLQWAQIFLEEQLTMAPDLHFHTNASGTLGYGGLLSSPLVQGDWDPSQLLGTSGISISYQELLPIAFAAFLCGSEWSHKRIFLCQ